MRTVRALLFESVPEKHDGKPLFTSYKELAESLVKDDRTAYHTSNEKLARSRIKTLQSYITQLVNERIARVVKNEFIDGLTILVNDRLDEPDKKDAFISEVVAALQKVNTPKLQKKTIKLSHENTFRSPTERLSDCYSTARYMVFTGHEPLETIIDAPEPIKNVTTALYDQLITYMGLNDLHLFHTSKRYFRYNVPDVNTAILLWSRLRKALYNELFAKKDNTQFVCLVLNNTENVDKILTMSDRPNKKTDPFLFDISNNRLTTENVEHGELKRRFVSALYDICDTWLAFLNYYLVIRVFVPVNPTIQLNVFVFNPEGINPKGFVFMNKDRENKHNYELIELSNADLMLWKKNYWTPLIDYSSFKSVNDIVQEVVFPSKPKTI